MHEIVINYLKCDCAGLELWRFRFFFFYFFSFFLFFLRFMMSRISFIMTLGMGRTTTIRTVNGMSTFWRYFRGIARKSFLWLSQNEALNRRLVSVSSLLQSKSERSPFSPACFSPCLPNPYPDLSNLYPLPPENLSSWIWTFSLRNEGVPANSEWRGRLSFDDSGRKERLDFADSLNTSPRVIFRHPMENRKKAETRPNSSTWWDRIAAPMLQSYV